jgi:hypothetical protein
MISSIPMIGRGMSIVPVIKREHAGFTSRDTWRIVSGYKTDLIASSLHCHVTVT